MAILCFQVWSEMWPDGGGALTQDRQVKLVQGWTPGPPLPSQSVIEQTQGHREGPLASWVDKWASHTRGQVPGLLEAVSTLIGRRSSVFGGQRLEPMQRPVRGD